MYKFLPILLLFLFHWPYQINSQPTDQQSREEDNKWPQNYPGGHDDGGVSQVNISNLPWVTPDDEEGDNDGNDGNNDEENGNDGNAVDRQHSKWPQNYPSGGTVGNGHGKGPFFPGHIGQWPGKHDWEDEHGRNRNHQRMMHEKEHKHDFNWLDWILPWRRYGHRHGKRQHQHEHGHEDSDEHDEDEHKHVENGTETVITRLSGGPIKGIVSYAAGKEKPANVFRGIPFAEPPLGSLRFSPLHKKKPWNMLWDATKYQAACLSNTTQTRSPQHYISEDCIYMNVFADPKCKKQKSGCPVLFYVHGGGFAYDSATMFNDTQIVQKYASDGVVFMIPAYRLGVFGFFDMGSDRPVKRNLGMHDIIFSLEWARRELHAFGGDPNRITIMGNSAGASAVSYLCASPAVKEGSFQQAIISSGVPFFTPNANLKQTYALLDHFNCIRDNVTNRTYSAKQKVECLRRVDSMELLRQQQNNEERGIVFSGPEKDKEILPEDNYVEMLKHWKPRPMIYLTTIHEFARWPGNNLPTECQKGLRPFGYRSNQSYEACMARYNETFETDHNMRVSYESMHAESFLTSLVNTRLGAKSYVGEFELANYSNHADDLYFFFGLHYIPLNTSDVKLMDIYYPKMVKNFLHCRAPDKDWEPQNWNGRNYFRIAFNVSDNGTLLEYPHGVDGYQDVEGLKFWLHDLAKVERNAREQQRNETIREKINKFRFRSNHSAESGEDDSGIWEQVFGGGNRHKHRHERQLLPTGISSADSFNSFLALLSDGANDNLNTINNSNETSTTTEEPVNTGEGAVAPGPPSIGANFMAQEGANAANEEDPASSIETVPSTLDQADANQRELGKVWSAFWLTLTITMLLAVAVLVTAVTKILFRYKNVRGYQPAEGMGNGTAFTEKTRIVHANGNNTMRYT